MVGSQYKAILGLRLCLFEELLLALLGVAA